MNEPVKPWEKPLISNVMTIFGAMVIKVETITRRTTDDEEIPR